MLQSLKTVSVLLPPDLDRKARLLAAYRTTSKSAMFRKIIKGYLDEWERANSDVASKLFASDE